MRLRPPQPCDADAIIALVDGVYREYGDRLFLEGADADLLDLAAHYFDLGGVFVVLVDEQDQVRATHAVVPIADRPGVCKFRRLYLDPALRGTGWGGRLMQWAIDWALAHGLSQVEFWSDVRFTRAHRFFERIGFIRGPVREMDDGAMPYREYFFSAELKNLRVPKE